MTTNDFESLWARLTKACQTAAARFGIAPVSPRRLDDAVSSALRPQKLIDNLAEAWRVSEDQARGFLEEHGLGALTSRPPTSTSPAGTDEVEGEILAASPVSPLDDNHITVRALNPSFNQPQRASQTVLDSVGKALGAFLLGAAADPLGVLYRDHPEGYADRFLSEQAPRMTEYIRRHFGGGLPRYLVNSGIGANEQFNYFVAALANTRTDRQTTWLLANSPKEIADLPRDATVENTLFMEFSRSGITEETVKLHELTPRSAKRIVFANTGPLRALAERDGNLILDLPSEVSGRYGRNKTPILLAPMYVVGLDVRSYWAAIEAACRTLDVSKPSSPAVVLARYLRVQQLRHGVNHIYLGTNDDLLRCSADEFCQFWNEGVNREGNDITMSRYLGLPRDSHMNLEAILGTSERKMAIFLLRTGGVGRHGLLLDTTDSFRPEHRELTAGDVDLILALANVKRCSEKMPTILLTVEQPNLAASAWLGQLWADVTLVYSRLVGVDPGSNPEVKAVRNRAATWLSDKNAAITLLGEPRQP